MFLELGLKLIEKLIPDPQAKQSAQLELLKLQQAGEFKQLEADVAVQLAQIEVNKTEASSANPFVSGWRPAVGWVCVLGLLYTFLLQPLLSYFGQRAAPAIDMSDLLILLGGLLGFGGLRTFEKVKGVARG
jgi:hypothetical protein